MRKTMDIPHWASDFLLHTTAVGNCKVHSALVEVLHKKREKHHARTIHQYATARDAGLEQEIYGDIHIIQHQQGGQRRDDGEAPRRLRAPARAWRQP